MTEDDDDHDDEDDWGWEAPLPCRIALLPLLIKIANPTMGLQFRNLLCRKAASVA